MNRLALTTAVSRVECSGAIHRLICADGALTALDHPDPDGERALTALGAPPSRCIQLLDAWQACRDDIRALVLGPRGDEIVPADATNSTPGSAFAAPSRFGGAARANRPPMRGLPSGHPTRQPAGPADPLFEILRLGGGLPRALVATAAAALAPRAEDPDLHARLHAALYGRVLVSLTAWLREMPELDLTLLSSDAAPSLARDGTCVSAGLPLDWLVDVWGPGLDVIAGRFSLAAAAQPPAGLELLSVDPLMAVDRCILTLG